MGKVRKSRLWIAGVGSTIIACSLSSPPSRAAPADSPWGGGAPATASPWNPSNPAPATTTGVACQVTLSGQIGGTYPCVASVTEDPDGGRQSLSIVNTPWPKVVVGYRVVGAFAVHDYTPTELDGAVSVDGLARAEPGSPSPVFPPQWQSVKGGERTFALKITSVTAAAVGKPATAHGALDATLDPQPPFQSAGHVVVHIDF